MANPNLVITEEASRRIAIIKVFMIILVVFIHSSTGNVNYTDEIIQRSSPAVFDYLQYLIKECLARVAVPMLFLLSGMLLYRKNFTFLGNLKRKVSTLLIPYLICNTIWIAIFFLFQQFEATRIYFTAPDSLVGSFGLVDWLDAYFCINLRIEPFLGPFWFIKDLFILNIFAVLIKKIVDRFPKIVLGIILVLLFIPWWVPYPVNLFHFDKQALYFILGYYFVKYQISFETISKKVPMKWVAIAYILLVLADSFLRYTSFYYVHVLGVLVGLLFWIRVSGPLAGIKSRPVVWTLDIMASSVFVIYAFHEYTLHIIEKLASRILPQGEIFLVIQFFALPLLVIAGCVAFKVAFQKTLPRVYHVVTGNRS